MPRQLIIPIFLLCVSCPFTNSWAHPLLNISLDDPMMTDIYAFVDRVALKYELKNLLKNQRPYSQETLHRVLEQLSDRQPQLTSVEQKVLAQLSRLISGEPQPLLRGKGEDYQFDLNFEPGLIVTHRTEPADPSGTEFAWQLRPIVSGGVRDDFALFTDLRFYVIPAPLLEDTVRAEIEIRHGDADYYSVGMVPGYVKFRLPWFELLIGKDNLSWGPGRRSNLLVSANPLPMDMFQIRAQYGKIGFQAFTSVAESPEGNKILSAHRLDINLWDRGNLGIAESLIIGQEDFEIRFLNPFTIYTAIEALGAGILEDAQGLSTGNLLISGDLEWYLSRNVSLYSELLIDDFQPRYGLNSYRNRGSKLGIQLGAYFVDPFSIEDTDFRIEYAFINQFAYTHRKPVSTYTHLNRLIGHEIGTDADDLWLNLRHWFSDKVSVTATYERQRHGEGDVNNPGDVYHPENEEAVSRWWEFLSGTRESSHAFSIEARYHVISEYLLKGRYTFSHITNLKHEAGITDNGHELVLTGAYRF